MSKIKARPIRSQENPHQLFRVIPYVSVSKGPKLVTARVPNGPSGMEPFVSLRVLVSDDEASQREVLSAFLAHLGHSVLVAVDGDDAIQTAQKERPDVVLLDLVMPKVNGLDVCRSLKLNSETKEIKVIMLTAIAQQSVVKLALQSGADAYLFKPIGAQDLASTLKTLFKTGVKGPRNPNS